MQIISSTLRFHLLLLIMPFIHTFLHHLFSDIPNLCSAIREKEQVQCLNNIMTLLDTKEKS